jgi:hypothetical protein
MDLGGGGKGKGGKGIFFIKCIYDLGSMIPYLPNLTHEHYYFIDV